MSSLFSTKYLKHFALSSVISIRAFFLARHLFFHSTSAQCHCLFVKKNLFRKQKNIQCRRWRVQFPVAYDGKYIKFINSVYVDFKVWFTCYNVHSTQKYIFVSKGERYGYVFLFCKPTVCLRIHCISEYFRTKSVSLFVSKSKLHSCYALHSLKFRWINRNLDKIEVVNTSYCTSFSQMQRVYALNLFYLYLYIYIYIYGVFRKDRCTFPYVQSD